MQITIQDNGLIRLTLTQAQGSLFGGWEASEELTSFELDQLIKKLQEASKQATYKRKGIKV